MYVSALRFSRASGRACPYTTPHPCSSTKLSHERAFAPHAPSPHCSPFSFVLVPPDSSTARSCTAQRHTARAQVKYNPKRERERSNDVVLPTLLAVLLHTSSLFSFTPPFALLLHTSSLFCFSLMHSCIAALLASSNSLSSSTCARFCINLFRCTREQAISWAPRN